MCNRLQWEKEHFRCALTESDWHKAEAGDGLTRSRAILCDWSAEHIWLSLDGSGLEVGVKIGNVAALIALGYSLWMSWFGFYLVEASSATEGEGPSCTVTCICPGHCHCSGSHYLSMIWI